MRVLTEKSWRSFYEKCGPLAVIEITRCSPRHPGEALTSLFPLPRGVDQSCQSVLRHQPHPTRVVGGIRSSRRVGWRGCNADPDVVVRLGLELQFVGTSDVRSHGVDMRPAVPGPQCVPGGTISSRFSRRVRRPLTIHRDDDCGVEESVSRRQSGNPSVQSPILAQWSSWSSSS